MPLYDVELQHLLSTYAKAQLSEAHVKGILHRWSNLLIGEEQFEVLEKKKLTNATDDTAAKEVKGK